MVGAYGTTFANARDPLSRSATNNTMSDHTSHTVPQNYTAHVVVVPNVWSAMLCASE